MAKTRPGVPSKIKPGRKELDSYTIKGTNKVVRALLFRNRVNCVAFGACFM
ncbi:hypothetical protein DY000_02054260 [Brassica cretica]|uniref:Uncharacterized protein n=1 Tax=Brassica cretica TaxID=69181 RepID=A0ABQ7AC33_BRACR|nr:hypothetical protein DY000_02054260 [Brassica cretica]